MPFLKVFAGAEPAKDATGMSYPLQRGFVGARFVVMSSVADLAEARGGVSARIPSVTPEGPISCDC